jgi:RNA polymerase sigma factor (sigma-70 family)
MQRHLTEAERHPDFDRYFAQYRDMMFWWAHKLAARLGGAAGDYVAFCVMRLNYVLHTFDAAKAKLTTFYASGIYSAAIHNVVKHESEASFHRTRAGRIAACLEHSPGVCSLDQEMASGEVVGTFLVLPGRDGPGVAEDLVEALGGIDRFWEAATRGLRARDAAILRHRFILGQKYRTIGERFGVSKARVQQIVRDALPRVRERIMQLPAVQARFGGDQGACA